MGISLCDIHAVAEIGQGLHRDRAERPSPTQRHEFASGFWLKRPEHRTPPVRPIHLLHRHLRTRVVPSARVVKCGNRQRAVEVRVGIRVVPRQVLTEAGLFPDRPAEPHNVPDLVKP